MKHQNLKIVFLLDQNKHRFDRIIFTNSHLKASFPSKMQKRSKLSFVLVPFENNLIKKKLLRPSKAAANSFRFWRNLLLVCFTFNLKILWTVKKYFSKILKYDIRQEINFTFPYVSFAICYKVRRLSLSILLSRPLVTLKISHYFAKDSMDSSIVVSKIWPKRRRNEGSYYCPLSWLGLVLTPDGLL